MRFFVCLLRLLTVTTACGLNVVVTTQDGRKVEGTAQITHQALTVTPASGDAVTMAVSNIAQARFSTHAPALAWPQGRGSGLLGLYFSSTNLDGVSILRLDETVNFDWLEEAPMAGITKDYFSVRWMGEIEAPVTDTYTIHFATDDGGRIYFDGQPVADHWSRHEYGETNFTVQLQAGEKHRLQLEYFDVSSNASVQLRWSTPTREKTIIPRDRLYPASFDPHHGAQLSGGPGLLATYYDNLDFMGDSFTRVEPGIDLRWSGSPPAPGLTGNVAGVCWSGNLLVTNSGQYRFFIVSGVPVRFYLNDKLLSNPWLGIQQTFSTTLNAGERAALRFEARATNQMTPLQLLWSGPGFPRSPVPATHLSPSVPAVGGVPVAAGPILPAGVVLVSGAILDAPLQSANESSVRFQGVLGRSSLPLAKVARLHLRPITGELAAALPKGRTGVLLKNRDFIDGDFAGIENGRLKLGSMLYGNRTFDLGREVVAVVLRSYSPPPWRWVLTARDGTMLYGKSITLEPMRVSLTDAPEFSFAPADLLEIKQRESGSAP